VWVDTWFYGADEWVLTSYNFLEMNVIHGLSKYFGTDGLDYYLRYAFFDIFQTAHIPAVLSMFYHCITRPKKGNRPYIALYSLFYIVVFTLIPHKETRFLMPIIPFVIICTAEFVDVWLHKYPVFVAAYIKTHILLEVITMAKLLLTHNRASQARVALLNEDPDMHSFYSIDTYNTPEHILFHRPSQPVKVYAPNKDGQFAK